MKNIISLAAAAAVLLSAPSFAASESDAVPGSRDSHSNVTNPPVDGLGEAQVVGVIDEVHTGEIDAAQLALKKSNNEAVLEFARRMIADHGDSRRRLEETGVKSGRSDVSAKLKAKHKEMGAHLSALNGPAFDRAYASAMVDGHTMVLEKTDKKLIPGAKTAALATYVQEFRTTVDSHLEHARRLKASLGTK